MTVPGLQKEMIGNPRARIEDYLRCTEEVNTTFASGDAAHGEELRAKALCAYRTSFLAMEDVWEAYEAKLRSDIDGLREIACAREWLDAHYCVQGVFTFDRIGQLLKAVPHMSAVAASSSSPRVSRWEGAHGCQGGRVSRWEGVQVGGCPRGECLQG